MKILIVSLLLFIGCGGEHDLFSTGFQCEDVPEKLRSDKCFTNEKDSKK